MPAKKPAAKTAPAEEQPYRLVELRAENFKKLKAVRIRPDGAVVTISGRNEQGKSSVLDAVSAALGGAAHFSDAPIREGAKEATIDLDFVGLKLTRRIWERKGGGISHEVRLEYADGQMPQKPQAILDGLRGSPIADDPLEFTRMDPKKRADLVKGLVPDFNFEANAAARKKLADTRLLAGRDYERLKGAAASMRVPENAPVKPVDIAQLTERHAGAVAKNAGIERMRRNREDLAEKIETLRDEADALDRQAKAKRQNALDMQRGLDEGGALPEMEDVSKIASDLASATERNDAYRARVARDEAVAARDSAEAIYDRLTQEIEAADKAKADAIAKAKLPVEGLQIDDDDVRLDGLPFGNASTARKIRVATALLMALKPDLRVLLVREGSLLDKDARLALQEDAEANGFVVLMECVGDGADGGVVIEDGELV